ncbi:MAG: CRISPR-associated protein Cas4 [Candidatus Altiarchaeota archaeon]|nr:CRISPR-associated protein Cas4 [Candidatus Altiarchaeota archaeon]
MNVQVSDLNAHSFCPRTIYLSKILKLKPMLSSELSQGLISHAVRRELSMRQSRLLEKVSDVDDIPSALECELDKILQEVPHIYRKMLADIDYGRYLEKTRSELLGEIALMAERLSLMVDEVGIKRAVEAITPWRVEYSVRSSSLRLSGRVDRIMKNPSYVPEEIKTGSVPSGVWEGDRLQTCAYAMLLEDQLDLKDPILFGFVEYTRAQEKRPVMTTEKLRREVIHIRDAVFEILGGSVPEICPHGNGRKCNGCGYKEQCYDI